MEEKIWNKLPIELYFIIKKLYLKKIEKSFRYHLAYKSAERQTGNTYTIEGIQPKTPLNIPQWEHFYDSFLIKEIMIKGLGFIKHNV